MVINIYFYCTRKVTIILTISDKFNLLRENVKYVFFSYFKYVIQVTPDLMNVINSHRLVDTVRVCIEK